MRKVLLFVWLPLIVFLFPLPPQVAKQLVSEIKSDHAAVANQGSNSAGTSARPVEREPLSQSEFDDLVATLWRAWLQNLGLLALGLFVGVMSWRHRPYWGLYALAMSVSYLAFVFLSPTYLSRKVPDSLLLFSTDSDLLRMWQLKFSLIEVGLSKGHLIRPAWIIYADFFMPIFQVCILVWLSWMYFKHKRQTTST
jgi:hypothetical protein